jgi:hypothetical protein
MTKVSPQGYLKLAEQSTELAWVDDAIQSNGI